ncbi:MAG: hypothetical protein WKF43_12625 [Acidimicrobiales bacterium]
MGWQHCPDELDTGSARLAEDLKAGRRPQETRGDFREAIGDATVLAWRRVNPAAG